MPNATQHEATTPHPAGRRVDHGPYRPLAALLEEQADRTPHRPAVTHLADGSETTLTYAEFDALANGLAADLAEAGVRRGETVPLALGNSLELPLAMAASAKLGAPFALCDPAWPADRMRAVLRTLGPAPVLAAGPLEGADRPPHLVSVASLTPRTARPGVLPGPGEPVYGVFTSGTTGTPKCALNLHGGLTNRLRFMTRWFGATGGEVVLQNSRHTFDSAIWQLLWPLTTGGRTVVPGQGEFLDLERTVEAIARHRVTVTDFVPTVLGMLVALLEASPEAVGRIRSLRHLVVGGEEILPAAVHRLRALVPGLEVTNGYGPSETSIGMVFHRVTDADGDRIPLGRPIDNCYAAVTDEALRPLPPGETGEIVVGGACVGGGYLGEPARTAEVFVPNPFPSVPGERVYRTGDLGWFDADGLLRFAGRRDRQAQVDGVRIELGEIETAAEGCRGVTQAKALTLRHGERTRLVVVAAALPAVTPTALRAHLVSVLPRVQVPQWCLVLPSLPVTAHGKADLDALRRVAEEHLSAGNAPVVRPGDPATARIAEVMRAVLGAESFAVDDDFLRRGGDSLSALSCALQVEDVLGVPVTMADLYEHRTPRALAGALLHDTPQPADGLDEPGLMERDAELPADLVRSAKDAGSPAAPPPLGTVLVTGATGFVGVRTVHRLLTHTGARVVCPVRARDDAGARRRVEEALRGHGLWDASTADRLEVLAGDLGRPRFGWTGARWRRYAAECDAVLHVGALVNFAMDYRAHRAANVLGTLEVLRFALAVRPVPLHHVSTLGVLQAHAAGAPQPVGEGFDPADAEPPPGGYSRSKWVAERLVLAAGRLGAPVTVHRLGEVMPAADNGVPNPRALTHLLLSAMVRLGLRPDTPMRSDYTPVDETSARLVAALAEPAVGGVYHVFRAGSVDLAALELPGRPGLPAPRTVPAGEFTAALRSAAETAGHSEASVLCALLGALPATGPDGTPDFGGLLADNPRLFTRDACTALDARHGLRERPLEAAVTAYGATLTHHDGTTRGR